MTYNWFERSVRHSCNTISSLLSGRATVSKEKMREVEERTKLKRDAAVESLLKRLNA